MQPLTLRDVIEVYEEKLRDVASELYAMKEKASRHSADYQHEAAEVIKALEVITDVKGCRSPGHRAFAAQFRDKYPYRRKED